MALQPPQAWPATAFLVPLGKGISIILQPSLCLQGSTATWLNQALPKIAEIIHLQDANAIKIEVATYATLYPDFR